MSNIREERKTDKSRRSFGVEGGSWVKECGCCKDGGKEWQSSSLQLASVLTFQKLLGDLIRTRCSINGLNAMITEDQK